MFSPRGGEGGGKKRKNKEKRKEEVKAWKGFPKKKGPKDFPWKEGKILPCTAEEEERKEGRKFH